jgi:hypothetical protein
MITYEGDAEELDKIRNEAIKEMMKMEKGITDEVQKRQLIWSDTPTEWTCRDGQKKY